MASAPRGRAIVQVSCAAIALLGFLPWAVVLAEALLQAIESPLPLQHSLLAWLVLLVPLWVLWFAIVSWRKRNETVMPAMLMAAPAVLITLLAIAMP